MWLVFFLFVLSRGVNPAVDVLGQPDFSSNKVQSVSASSLSSPTALALDEDDSLYVVDAGNRRVLFYRWDAHGNRFFSKKADRVYGQRSFSSATCDRDGFRSISTIALDPRDGSLWISATGCSNNVPAIFVYPKNSTTQGSTLTFDVCGSTEVQSIAFAPSGYFIYCGPRIYFFRFGANTPSIRLGVSGSACSTTGVPEKGSMFAVSDEQGQVTLYVAGLIDFLLLLSF